MDKPRCAPGAHEWHNEDSPWWTTCGVCEHQRWDGRRTVDGPPQPPGLERGDRVTFIGRLSGRSQSKRMEGIVRCFFMKDIENTEAVCAMVVAGTGCVYDAPVTRFQHASAVDALGSIYEPDAS